MQAAVGCFVKGGKDSLVMSLAMAALVVLTLIVG